MKSRALSLVTHPSDSNHSRCDIAVPSGATASLPFLMQNMRRARWKSKSPLWVRSSSKVIDSGPRGHDEIDVAGGKFRREAWQRVEHAGRVTGLDEEILSLRPAVLAKRLEER